MVDISLTGRDGRLWNERPVVDHTGLISSITNDTRSHRSGVRSPRFAVAAFNRRGDVVCAASQQGQVFALFVAENRWECVKNVGISPVSIAASPSRSGEFLLGFSDGSVRCVDVGLGAGAAVVCTLGGHKGPVAHVAVHRDGEYALSASSEAVILWSTRTWQRVRVLGGGVGVAHCGFVADRVGVLFRDGSFMAWGLASLNLDVRLAAPDAASSSSSSVGGGAGGRAGCFSSSEDGRALATASGSRTAVHVWELQAQTLVRVVDLPIASHAPTQLEFLPRSKTLALLGSAGASVLFADVTSPACRVLLDVAPRGGVAALRFAVDPNGQYLALCCSDGSLQLFDIDAARAAKQQGAAAQERTGIASQGGSLRARSAPGAANTFDAAAPAEDQRARGSALDRAFGGGGGGGSSSRKHRARGASAAADEGAASRSSPGGGKVEWTPLYRLAKLEPSEQRLNKRRLKALLGAFGEFPAKYRLLVWRFLLKLPENRDSFAGLAAKGTHPAYARLERQYPIQSRRLFTKLQRTLSCLAHWSPVMGEVPYLPALAFPFVKLFGTDDLAAFETTMCVLMHWGAGWLDTFPHPPVPVLNASEALLRLHDPQLHAHFVRHGVNAQTFAWSLLRSLFSEVLAKADWLKLWDVLFSNAEDPSLLLVAVTAFLKYWRVSLLAAQTAADFEGFFGSTCVIDMPRFVNLLHSLRAQSPPELMRAMRQAALPSMVAFSGMLPPAAVMGATAAEAEPTGSVWPLPHGAYPAFNRFPKVVVDYQVQERERIRLDEEDLERKRQLEQTLREKKAALQQEEESWRMQHDALQKAEETRQREAEEQRHRFAAEKHRVEESIRSQRMQEVARMEEVAKQALKRQSDTQLIVQQRLQAELEAMKQEQAAFVATQLEEEALRNLEFQASQRVAAVMSEHDAEQQLLQHKRELLAREKAQKLQDKLTQEAWRTEDEAATLKASMKQAADLKKHQQLAAMRARGEVEHAFQVTQLERESKLTVVERERRLRQLADEQATQLQSVATEAEAEEALLAKENEYAAKLQVEQEAAWRKQKNEQRMAIVEQERQRLALETEKRQHMIRDLELRQRKRDFEDKLRAAQQLETEESKREEKQMQAVLLELEEERRQHRQTHLELLLEAQATEDRLAFAKAQREAEAEIIAKERERFDKVRDDLRARHNKEVASMVQEHGAAVSKEMHERDRNLLDETAALQQQVRQEGLSRLASEFADDSDDELQGSR